MRSEGEGEGQGWSTWIELVRAPQPQNVCPCSIPSWSDSMALDAELRTLKSVTCASMQGQGEVR